MCINRDVMLPIILGVSCTAMLGVVNVYELFRPLEPATGADLNRELIKAGITKIPDVVHQSVSMLMTIALSLFVFVGFSAKLLIDSKLKITNFFVIFTVIFMMLEALSLNQAYFIRADVIDFVLDVPAGTEHIEQAIAYQALFVQLSFAVALVISGHALLLFLDKEKQASLEENPAADSHANKGRVVPEAPVGTVENPE